MRVFVTGTGGQVGRAVLAELQRRGHEAIGSTRAELDITHTDAVERTITQVNPDAVVHCAAWTAVDLAEEMPEGARAVNETGTANIAAVCGRLGCKLVYVSTDYVFDGTGTAPWKPEDPTHPLNVYGRTKLAGEAAVAALTERYVIVRTAWVFGSGRNFVNAILAAGRKHGTVRVVRDQIGTPTYAGDLARLLVDMAESTHCGCYHATNEGGYVSWYEFAREIFRQSGHKVEVIPVSTQEYGFQKAQRPRNSRLDRGKLREHGFRPLPDWREALGRYLKEIEE